MRGAYLWPPCLAILGDGGLAAARAVFSATSDRIRSEPSRTWICEILRDVGH